MLKNKQINYQNFTYSLKKEFENIDKSLCIITKDNHESKYLIHELKIIFPNYKIYLFPENDLLPYDHFSIPEIISKERFKLINQDNKDKTILVTSIKNLFERYPLKESFRSLNKFKINFKISLTDLVKIINSLNYIKKTNVEKINEYAVRGGIIDVFTPLYENPIRIEIFDDAIETIRFFNIETQSSIKNINEFYLSKGTDISIDENSKVLFVENWRNYFISEDERNCLIFQKIKKNIRPEGLEIYLPFFFKKTSSFFELFNNFEFIKSANLDNEINKYYEFINERYTDEKNGLERPVLKPNDLFFDIDTILSKMKEIKNLPLFKINLSIDSFKSLETAIKNKEFKGKKLYLISSLKEQIEKLKSKYNNISKKIETEVNILEGNICRPIFDIDKNRYYFHKEYMEKSQNVISNTTKNSISTSKSTKIFNKGDYVIHEDYGLGIYEGLEVIEANNAANEYLKIIYANKENLYVPFRNANKISNYHKKSPINFTQLDSLSSKKWTSKKNKAIKKINDHASEILDIESRRNSSESISLKVSDNTINEFENDFPFEETNDQKKSFISIRHDLSLVKPMNRVLCGDVGFGKTEVAMKSSFISVMSGKQVIMISPSTILSDQHFNSFIDRFRNYPVVIRKLTRHSGLKKKKQIIEDFNKNKIDILISTHMAFNDDINYKNIGLLIVDEEHKFGIKQKNYIKNKQSSVHTLYLSATPIPRTMNLVYSGLKDFSFLQTPPSNRLSVKSFLKIQTSQLLKEALSREYLRGGQCFIVQNDIKKMKSLVNEINSILPNFKVNIAHGKLNKNEITKVMNDFKSGEIDGLICTTIVEMGLDISNANTIVIIDSHNFGLSQLHQLRGRVGRSHIQGYCYYLIPTLEIPKISRSRLDSVIRHSKLGEGFLIAEEDLEIRGGGEILGDKQSGHIDNIGLSLYLSMLKECIDKLKSNKQIIKNDLDINFYDSAFICSDYLPSPVERLKIYKKISLSEDIDTLKDIELSLIDRCGKMPNELQNLFNNQKIVIRISKSGIKSIKSNDRNTNIVFSKKVDRKVFKNLINLISSKPNIFTIDKENKFTYKLHEKDPDIRRNNVNLLLDEII